MSMIDQGFKTPPANGDAQVKGQDLGQEKLMKDFKMVLADAEALLKASADQGGEKLDEIRAKVRESLQLMNVRLAATQHEIGARTREAATATNTYVHANPWTSIGVATGAGLLIGLLLRRR